MIYLMTCMTLLMTDDMLDMHDIVEYMHDLPDDMHDIADDMLDTPDDIHDILMTYMTYLMTSRLLSDMSVSQWAVFTVCCVFVFLAEAASVRLLDMGQHSQTKGATASQLLRQSG